MTIKAVVFDLDGTLVDSLDDLTDAMNFALSKFGFPEHAPDDCKAMIGHGLRFFCSKALPAGKQGCVDGLMLTMRDCYKSQYLNKTKPFDGIPELCKELKQRGIILIVETNKDQNLAIGIVEGLFGTEMFKAVVGADNGIAVKPEPDKTLEILDRFSLRKEEVLFVGDSEVDIATAINAGIRSVGVSWGLRSVDKISEAEADHIIDKPIELLELLT